MSRSASHRLAFALAAFGAGAGVSGLGCAVSLSAQQKPAPVTAEQAIEDARAAYGPPSPKKKCEEQSSDEIVVCAEEQEQSQFRIRSDDKAKDDYARETMNQGNPPAPDVAGPGIFKGKATFSMGAPPPPALIIDFSALPEAPPGSDADRIAKGLPPLGEGQSPAPAAPLPQYSPTSAPEVDPEQ